MFKCYSLAARTKIKRMKIAYTFILLIFALFLNCQALQCKSLPGQTVNSETDSLQTDTVHFNARQMLSILVGIRKPGMDQAWRDYINTIFLLAMQHQYNPGSAFNVLEPSRGNYHPGFVAMAGWPSVDHQQKFLQDPNLPKDLSQQRRNIWSRFDQLIYEKLEKEIAFEVRSDKVYVITAYWIADAKTYKKYEKASLAKMKKYNGHLVLQLPGGSSPKNHLYDPDVWMISEWDDAETFKKYLLDLEQSGLDDGLKNINEFITSYVFNF